MILLSLFIAFLQIGILAFGGGYAILPFIQDIVVRNHGWLSAKEMTDVVTISQMTPGPIALNAATFVGTKMSGLVGSIIATTAIILPQLIIMVLLGKLYFGNKKINFMEKIIRALRPAIAGLIFIATLDMIKGSIFNNTNYNFSQISYVAVVCFVIGGILYVKKVGIVKIISIGAVLGVVLSLII
ncbi:MULTISPECIES: chromate transporter [Helcococcus]|uniref:Chromate transporter n=1 Tax=Helcococcus bovis TaxID=3153252 RepID=A0ABW9F5A0_9FIRM